MVQAVDVDRLEEAQGRVLADPDNVGCLDGMEGFEDLEVEEGVAYAVVQPAA